MRQFAIPLIVATAIAGSTSSAYATCLSGAQAAQVRARIAQIHTDFNTSCVNPTPSQLQAAPRCAPDEGEDQIGMSENFCGPLCSGEQLKAMRYGSGQLWTAVPTVTDTHQVSACMMPRRDSVLRAVPGGTVTQAQSYEALAQLKQTWVRDYNQRFRPALNRLLASLGSTPRAQSARQAIQNYMAAVSDLVPVGHLTSERLSRVADAFNIMTFGCAHPVDMACRAPQNPPVATSVNDLQADRRAANPQAESDPLFDDFFGVASELDYRVNELRMVSRCRGLEQDLRTQVARMHRFCQGEARCDNTEHTLAIMRQLDQIMADTMAALKPLGAPALQVAPPALPPTP